MNLHEYQAKQLIAKYGIAIPKGLAIKSIDELDQSIEQLIHFLMSLKPKFTRVVEGKRVALKL